MQRINIKTVERSELVDITDKVQSIISGHKIEQGICFIFVPHTTAGITINENADPSVEKDITDTLSKIIPDNAGYSHVEGNADSHIKSSLLGNCLPVIIEGGRLCLGRWQGIFFAESDGPRSREVWVEFIKK
ncbi:MAG: secondary thiamine-phosphate synthase enzyme YjbQ [Candidatus Omnitrophica bacterium]|nr:secondary thiamine-phosphate synthase enzyme YjbQ [Candidatus Omnitrophota bacterium]MBU1871276.1 secondary thiamine-phosphate synthase enzyme YjbQ [Candidatus Omnitrophota bacterium]